MSYVFLCTHYIINSNENKLIAVCSFSPVTNSEIDASLWLGGTDDADGDAKIDSARAMSLTYFIKTFRSGDDPEVSS